MRFESKYLFLLLGRALSGLAAGAFVPTAYAVVGDRVPYTYRGKVMGLIVSSWSLALIFECRSDHLSAESCIGDGHFGFSP